MTGWAADRHITPRVIDYLYDHLPDVPVKHRPTFEGAQCVLRALCRWARREPKGEHAGMWLADDTVGQLAAATHIAPGTIRNALGALEYIGLTVTLSHGGGRGLTARGATRRLVLDPVDADETPRAEHAEFPTLWIPKLRVPGTETPRAQRETPRAIARDTASSACTTYPRAGDAGEIVTTNDDERVDARAAYERYKAKAKADGKRVLTPAVYFAIIEGDP
jgi:hypothetical protein